MHFAPQQNWNAYRQLTRPSDDAWLRGLSVDERYAIYRGLFNTLRQARQAQATLSETDLARLENWHWRKKLAERDHFVKLFQPRDTATHE